MWDRRAPCRQPLLWAALAFATGIAIGARLWRPAVWWLAAAAIFALASARLCIVHLREPEQTAETAPAVKTQRWTRWQVFGPVPAPLRSWFAKLGRPRRDSDRWLLPAAWLFALASMLALGAWCAQAAVSAARASDLPAFISEQKSRVCGHVIRDGLVRYGLYGSLDVETENISVAGDAKPVVGGVRLSVTGAPQRKKASRQSAAKPNPFPLRARHPEQSEGWDNLSLEPLTYGQRLCFIAKLRAPREFKNPGASDYRAYLAQQGIVATAAAKAETVVSIPGFAGSRWQLWRSRIRRSVLRRIRKLWTSEQARLFDALLIGERAFIDQETHALWQRTGLYHLLVVSGMKVAILAFFVLWLVRWLRGGELAATGAALAAAGFYAYLAEMGAPALRATLMLAIYLLSRLLYRDHSELNALGTAALIMLAARPQSLFDASFQLTFFCMLALGGLALPLLERTSEPYRRALRSFWNAGYDLALPPRLVQFRLDLRLLATRLGALLPLSQEAGSRAGGLGLGLLVRTLLFLHDAILLTLVTQIAMILPMDIYFHRAVLAGAPANLVAVPLTGVLLPAATVAVALSYIWLPGAKIAALVAARVLSIIVWSARWLGGTRFGDLRLPTPSFTRVLVVATAFALAIVLIRRRAWMAAAGVAVLVAASAWITSFPAAPKVTAGVMEVTAIDVGHAESTLLVTPQGRTILVDAGSGPTTTKSPEFDSGEEVVSRYLWSRGFSHLDALLLTHAHSDHRGGMPSVIANFHPQELWLGPAPEDKIADLKDDIARVGGRALLRLAGDQFEYGGAQFTVFAPPRDYQPGSNPQNSDSVVLLVRFGNTSALLTGDVEGKIEREIAAQLPPVDLLKVAHNGSESSTTSQFLAATQPRFAFLFAGVLNQFRDPKPTVLERLAEAHVATYRTDTMGAVTFLLDGKTVTPRVLSLEERPEW
jgi:competence protein ComEC